VKRLIEFKSKDDMTLNFLSMEVDDIPKKALKGKVVRRRKNKNKKKQTKQKKQKNKKKKNKRKKLE